ncbi:MAG: DNA translocase FtsK [Rhodothermaceae bacterium]|nr:DNA translocase FtsK [Rhodothermaceae bacterium]
MADRKANRRRGSSTTSKTKKRPPSRRRQEVLGILILTLGVFLAIAGGTYSSSDNTLIEGKSFWELLFPLEGISVSNAAGAVGAWLAYAAVPSFFGYTSLFLIIIILLCGYTVLRKRPLRTIWIPAIHVIWIVCLGAIIFGRLSLYPSMSELEIWAGDFGFRAAFWLNEIIGGPGSWVILGASFIVGLMLAIDLNIQHWLDRTEQVWKSTARVMKEHRDKSREERAAEKASGKDGLQSTWEDLDPQSSAASVETRRNNMDSEPQQNVELEQPHVTEPSAEQPTREIDRTGLELKVNGKITEEAGHTTGSRSTQIDGVGKYKFPHIRLLEAPKETEQKIDYDELEENKIKLVEKLARHKIEIIEVNAKVGPTVTLYELTPAPGVKVSRIKSLEDDLAMAMAAQGIRMIVPIPNKSAVGVEIPNSQRELVRVQSVINTARFQESNMELPVVLGKTIEGGVFVEDLTKMPHLLIAGATGSGKSVGLNTLITGLLYACAPSDLKFVMIDPKKVELQQYEKLEHHFLAMPEDGSEAIVTEVEDALNILRACEQEMDARYDLLKDAAVRGIKSYNTRFSEGALDPAYGHKYLPYIVVIIDELADLMLTAGKDVEAPIARLAQKARAIGVHLILATQRPSVDVITGLIKANFPSRVAFQVASKVDARTILDQNGAEQLVGNGDMLYMTSSKVMRLQGPFVSGKEIDRLIAYITKQPEPSSYRLPKVELEPAKSSSYDQSFQDGATDHFFDEAARIIVREQQGSVSLIQRKLSIGYTRAARIVDQLEQAGVVGPPAGAKPRDVLVANEVALERLLYG